MQTLLLYAQDSKGLGHITRATTIARHVLAANPRCIAYIVTESPAIQEFTFPDRCDFIKLPKRQTPNGPEETPEELEASKDYFRDIRSAILKETALSLAPDLVLVDHVPLGYRGEFREGLLALRAERPRTKFVLGLRDIMDAPSFTRAQWQGHGEYDALESLYDGILVYGQRDLFDVAVAYGIPPAARAKMEYVGYLVREPVPADREAERRALGIPSDAPLVVATVGSGVDGFPVLRATLAAVRALQRDRPDLHAFLVTGPFMPRPEQESLRGDADSLVRVVPRADNLRLMACADAVVSMGGYNSVFEVLRLGRPLVIVPRSTHKIEQQMRAETLAARGLARCVMPDRLSSGDLVPALEWALGSDPQVHARRVREVIRSFDGITRTTAYLTECLRGRPAALPQTDGEQVLARSSA